MAGERKFLDQEGLRTYDTRIKEYIRDKIVDSYPEAIEDEEIDDLFPFCSIEFDHWPGHSDEIKYENLGTDSGRVYLKETNLKTSTIRYIAVEFEVVTDEETGDRTTEYSTYNYVTLDSEGYIDEILESAWDDVDVIIEDSENENYYWHCTVEYKDTILEQDFLPR